MFIVTIMIVLLAAVLLVTKWRVNTRLRNEVCSKVVDAQLFSELVDQEIKRASRSRAFFSIVYLQARETDSSGGTMRDEILMAVAAPLLEHLRATDVVARLGDGLAVLMPNTGKSGVQSVVQKIKKELGGVAKVDHWASMVGTYAFTLDGSMMNPLETSADALISEVRKAGRENTQATFLAPQM